MQKNVLLEVSGLAFQESNGAAVPIEFSATSVHFNASGRGVTSGSLALAPQAPPVAGEEIKRLRYYLHETP